VARPETAVDLRRGVDEPAPLGEVDDLIQVGRSHNVLRLLLTPARTTRLGQPAGIPSLRPLVRCQRSNIATVLRRRSMWCSRALVARVDTSWVAADGSTASASFSRPPSTWRIRPSASGLIAVPLRHWRHSTP